ncbi:phosphopantetheine-binding protein [Saccharothrix syringae]|uniref:Carrier domain-containing protein n=1 Tax=Saccharothrix syringae TaxID=103733 RepID=A0A5Q0GYN7_SACSY|nr:phosphopantetheine-binding protein [Saccharothrix syringae]QFZ18610.1 hypothetical protein EKG83_15095 [Saccharothrix syringae]
MSTTDRDTVDFTALIREVLSQALDVDQDAGALPLDVPLVGLPNMSSLAMLRGVVLLEGRLGLELDDDELVTASTIGELAAVVERQYLRR